MRVHDVYVTPYVKFVECADFSESDNGCNLPSQSTKAFPVQNFLHFNVNVTLMQCVVRPPCCDGLRRFTRNRGMVEWKPTSTHTNVRYY